MTKRYKQYTFEDGYICIVRGFSKFELKREVEKHGAVVSIIRTN